MKFRMYLSAFFKMRNIGLLLLFAGMSAVLGQGIQSYWASFPVSTDPMLPTTYVPALVFYLGVVIQTLFSKNFHESFNRKEKKRQIQNLNLECLRLAMQAKKYTNQTYYQKLKKVMEDKNDIVNSFLKGEHSYLKEKVVEQTLNLVVSYIKLLTNFCIRSREMSEMDVSDVVNRINANIRKLNFVKDPAAGADIKRLIEMDERVVNSLKDEKNDLERTSARLEYMESTVNAFKHQIFANIESEEMVEKLETAVNEATALGNVLEERRKSSRVRI